MATRKVDPAALGRRLARRRTRLGLSQDALAAAVGMKQQGIDAIEQGRVMRPRLLREISRALGVTDEWLLWGRGGEPEPQLRVPAGEEFAPDPAFEPVVTERDRPFRDALPQMAGRIGGGSTGTVISHETGELDTREEVSDWWRIPAAVLRGLARADASRTVGFVMEGDSMEPTVQRTDVVFVDTSRRTVEADGIWAVDFGLGRTLKRIAVERGDRGLRYVLKSDNKMYADLALSPDEVTVIGRYVGRFSVF
jgi:phage repressor protein C with HTH and peptisase S24 domain